MKTQVTVAKQIELTIRMTEEEAQVLMDMMQNPINQEEDEEGGFVQSVREGLFQAVHDVLRGTE